MNKWWEKSLNIYYKFKEIHEKEAFFKGKEYYANKETIEYAEKIIKIQENISNNEANIDEWEPELKGLLEEETQQLKKEKEKLMEELEEIFTRCDNNDSEVILEIRCGAGGVESSLFAMEMLEMYQSLAVRKKWKNNILYLLKNEAGGLKEVVLNIEGEKSYFVLQHEAGVHRVQRVPETESCGRIHTSTITVAILKQENEEDVFLRDEDLDIQTCRASGAGGQHVNTTDSAVRIVHLPTGIFVQCQDERSQIKNKDKAKKNLLILLQNKHKFDKNKERTEERLSQIGTGNRWEKIRTYNFAQNRVTDHRINFSVYNLTEVLKGGKSLDILIEELVKNLK